MDEFCWRKTDNGVPGGWGNRFKNAWEPVFHFCRQQQIKFRPKAVGHESEDCFDYCPNNPKSTSGSGLLGTGPRGAAAMAAEPGCVADAAGSTCAATPRAATPAWRARRNVIEVKSESCQGSHSAPFPRALVEFFLLAFSDPGDVVYDPFMGSGTTMAAAHLLDRAGYGCEFSPGLLRRDPAAHGEPGRGDAGARGDGPAFRPGRGGARRGCGAGVESEGRIRAPSSIMARTRITGREERTALHSEKAPPSRTYVPAVWPSRTREDRQSGRPMHKLFGERERCSWC